MYVLSLSLRGPKGVTEGRRNSDRREREREMSTKGGSERGDAVYGMYCTIYCMVQYTNDSPEYLVLNSLFCACHRLEADFALEKWKERAEEEDSWEIIG